VIALSVFSQLLFYSFACLGLGEILLNLLSKNNQKNRASSGIYLATAYLLGQGLLANFWVLLAIYSRFIPMIVIPTIFILSICGTVLSYTDIIGLLHKIKTNPREYSWTWRVLISLIIILVLAWITSLGRSTIGDGSSFYLAIAKVIANSHRLQPLPGYEDLTSIGLQAELHFAALMLLGSPGAAQVFAWPIFLAGAVMLLALSRKAGVTWRGQWFILAMLFTSTAVTELSGSGKTDLFATSLGFAAYFWATEIRNEKKTMAAWLTGLLMGLTLIAKISYILTFIPSMAVFIIWSYFTNPSKPEKKPVLLSRIIPLTALILVGTTIALTPHFIKNYVLFDNALAPLNEKSSGWQDQSWNGPETTRRILATLPFSLTFGDYYAQFGNLSPLFLMFLPLIFLTPKPKYIFKNQAVIITLSTLIGLTIWFIFRPTVFAPRYFMACLLILSIPIAGSAEYLTLGKSRFFKIMIPATTILVLLSSGLYNLNKVFFPKETFKYLTGRMSECDKALDYCSALNQINQTTKPGDRLFTDTVFRYWLRTDLIECALTKNEVDAYRELESPKQRWAFIFGRGFTYIPIFYTGNQIQNTILDDLNYVPNWLSISRINNIYDDKNYLIQLAARDLNHHAVVKCGQVEPPSWELFNISY